MHRNSQNGALQWRRLLLVNSSESAPNALKTIIRKVEVMLYAKRRLKGKRTRDNTEREEERRREMKAEETREERRGEERSEEERGEEGREEGRGRRQRKNKSENHSVVRENNNEQSKPISPHQEHTLQTYISDTPKYMFGYL